MLFPWFLIKHNEASFERCSLCCVFVGPNFGVKPPNGHVGPLGPSGEGQTNSADSTRHAENIRFPTFMACWAQLGMQLPPRAEVASKVKDGQVCPPVGLRWAKQARVLTPHPQPPYSLTWKSPLDGKFPFLLPASSLSYNQGVVVLVAKRLKYDGKSYNFQTNGFNNSPMEKGNSS